MRLGCRCLRQRHRGESWDPVAARRLRNAAKLSGEVYDEDPKCPLCACKEHKPRLLTVRDHSTSATAWSGVGEGRRGSQPELPGGRRALPSATARRCPGTRVRERSRPAPPRQSAASGTRPLAVAAHTAPVRARPYPASANPPALGIRPGYGRPRPSLLGTPISGARCCCLFGAA
jgi:hypothetical protein